MPICALKRILDEANAEGYAVPAFDTIDHASVEAVIAAAETTGQPVIIMVPEAAIPLIDQDNFFDYLVYRIGKASVPIALELDHGKSLDLIKAAINAGFSGVMIDGSELPNEENIALTKQVVELAHAAGVSVEAEIGHVAGGEGDFFYGSEVDESMYTKPEDAKRFVEATGVDALAVAFGTVHGVFKGEPKLDFNRLDEIKSVVDIPLVMHGGSGVSKEDFAKAVKHGVSKINLFTEISMAAVKESVEFAQARDLKLHFAEMIMIANITVNELASGYLKLFSLE
jgi:fructose-bisphosphate aldolase class II